MTEDGFGQVPRWREGDEGREGGRENKREGGKKRMRDIAEGGRKYSER